MVGHVRPWLPVRLEPSKSLAIRDTPEDSTSVANRGKSDSPVIMVHAGSSRLWRSRLTAHVQTVGRSADAAITRAGRKALIVETESWRRLGDFVNTLLTRDGW